MNCAFLDSAREISPFTIRPMPITDRAEFERLMLQIERDLLAQAQLRALLTVADKTVADDRQQLRTVKARLKRTRR